MSPVRSCICQLALVAVVLVIADRAHIARARDDDNCDQTTAARLREERVSALRTQIDRQTFVRLGIEGFKFPDFLELLLLRRINHLASDGRLAEAQLRKLKVAGRADIRRYVDRLDQIASTLERAQTDSNELGKASLTLGETQRALHEQRLRERNRIRYHSAIHEVAESMASAVRMTGAQRRMFEELLQREIRTPRRFGRFSQSERGTIQDADAEVVLAQAARISDAKLNAALGETLSEKLSRRLSRWSGMDIENWLKSRGYMFDVGPLTARFGRAEAETKTEKP
jgi:hypothetical protein